MANFFEKIGGVIKDADRANHLAKRGGRQARKLKKAKAHKNKAQANRLRSKISKTKRQGVAAYGKTVSGSVAAAQQGVRLGAALGAVYAAPSYPTVGMALANFVE